MQPLAPRRKCHRRFTTLLVLLLWAKAATSQNSTAIAEFTHRVWHVQDGLADQVVQALGQTRDHYLWIGTNKGLVRFDGSDFEPLIDPALAHGVTCLLTASDGSLYIGTPGRGLLRMVDGRLDRYADGPPDLVVRALFQQSNGTIWVGTESGLLRVMNGHLLRTHLSDDPSADNLSTAIAQDSDGNIWSGGTRLFRISGATITQLPLPHENGATRIRSLVRDADGSIWIGTGAGLYHHDRKRGINKVAVVDGTVRTLLVDDKARLWAGTAGNGLYLRQTQDFQHLDAADVLPSQTVLSQFIDDEGNIWLGTPSGLLRLSRMGMHRIPIAGWTDSDFGSVMLDRDDTLWICSSKLFHLHGGHAETHHFAGAGNFVIRTMLRDADGNLWLGSAGGGVFHLDRQGRISRLAADREELFVRGFLRARDGSLWIRNDGTFEHFANGQLEQYHSPSSTSTMAEDLDGHMWMGTEDGLFTLREGELRSPRFGRFFDEQSVWSIVPRPNQTLWIGTGAGFFAVTNGKVRQLGIAHSTVSTAVYQILLAPKGMVWLAGPTRVYHLSVKTLQNALDKNTPLRSDLEIFSVSSEIQSAEIYAGKEATGVVEPDGSAWFATTQGPVHLIPGERHEPNAIPMRISGIIVDGHQQMTDNALDLGPHVRAIQIHFAPTLLSSQTGLSFQYRLNNFDDWSPPTTNRTATYTDLPAGLFNFEVRAVSDTGKQIGFIQLPVRQRAIFYRTMPFYLTCVLVVGALAWVVHRLRVSKIRNEFQMIALERSRIARELHDTVIRGCTAAFAVLDGAVMTMASPAPLVEVARKQISETIKEAREAVWDLRQETDRDRLASNLRNLLEKTAESTEAKCRFHVIGIEPPMTVGIAHELLMTSREALTNAVTHSDARHIDMTLRCTEATLTLLVADDGCGFDPQGIREDLNIHYGLKGMQERITSLGGTFEITSRPDTGTTVQLHIPYAVLKGR